MRAAADHDARAMALPARDPVPSPGPQPAKRPASTAPKRDAFLRQVVAQTRGKPFDSAHASRVEVSRDDCCRFLIRFQNGRHLRIEVSIEAKTPERSEAVFALLLREKNTIEQTLGYPLVWEGKQERLRCTIHAGYPAELDLHDDTSNAAALNWVVTQIGSLQAVVSAVMSTVA